LKRLSFVFYRFNGSTLQRFNEFTCYLLSSVNTCRPR